MSDVAKASQACVPPENPTLDAHRLEGDYSGESGTVVLFGYLLSIMTFREEYFTECELAKQQGLKIAKFYVEHLAKVSS